MSNINGQLQGLAHASMLKLRVVPRWARRKWNNMVRIIDQRAVISGVDEDGSLRASYLFMCVMASGIAVTGLLVNSPAVIIGAMLISPLMAPIVRLGLGVATMDHERAQEALVVLTLGMAFALLTAMTIVWLSPIQELTSEISARIRPSLFDLVVAVLSGLAGGYAVVRGRGGAIVGVAIATALMPPMAVVGYGLATSQWLVAKGALLLFVTNLVAISLSITAIMTWYGFSRRRIRHSLVWQTGLAVLLLLPLAIPLWQSLRAITREAQIAQAVRRSVANVLGAQDSRVLNLLVANGEHGNPTRIDLTIATRHYSVEDGRRLREAIRNAVDSKTDLRLAPIIEADPEGALLANARRAAAAALVPAPAPRAPAPDPVETLLAHFPIPLAGKKLDLANREMTLFPSAGAADLTGSRELEINLAKQFPTWKISVVPPIQALPAIEFGRGLSTLDANSDSNLQLIQWTLKQWGVSSVQVFGFASSEGTGNAQLAMRRAAIVSDYLTKSGISAEPVVAFQQPAQRQTEKSAGRAAYRIAQVVPHGSGGMPDKDTPPNSSANLDSTAEQQ
jgi:uncharacterized hydrophobic protein (TIGR00271 family)